MDILEQIERGLKTMKARDGFVLRVDPELGKKAKTAADLLGITLYEYGTLALLEKLRKDGPELKKLSEKLLTEVLRV